MDSDNDTKPEQKIPEAPAAAPPPNQMSSSHAPVFDDVEPETYVSPEGRPIADVPSAPMVTTPPQKKSRKKAWLVWGIVLVLLACLGALAYWQYTEAQNAKTETASVKSELAAAQAAANKQTTEETAAVEKDLVPQTQMSTAALDTVEAYMSTKDVTRQQYEASIPYMDADFARVQVNYVVSKNKPTGKGETFYFKRVERTPGTEAWAMIGNNPMTTEEITSMKNRYGVPDVVITGDKPA